MCDTVIQSVETFPVSCAIPAALTPGSSKGFASFRSTTFVKVTTTAGVSGWGECFGNPILLTPFLRQYAGELVGRSVEQREERLLLEIGTAYHMGYSGPQLFALSGLDIALWDAQARILNISLATLLGGRCRETVFAYASGGFIRPRRDIGEFKAQIEEYVSRGFKAVKIRVGTGRDEDRRRTEAARRILGPDCRLMVDYNGNQTFDTARRSIEALRDMDIAWFEEPLPPHDVSGWRLLRDFDITLAGGEALATRFGFREAVRQRQFDLYQPDLGICGGFTEALAIKAMVLAENARFAPHCWCGAIGQAAALQLIATLPSTPYGDPSLGDAAGKASADAACFEFDVGFNPLATDATSTPFQAKNSLVTIPDGPGLGITMDEDWLNAHLVKDHKIHVDG